MNVKNIKPIAVLVSICIVVAALLGAVNLLTKDVIAENAIRKEQESLRKVLPGGDIFEEISIGEEDGIAGTVKTVYRETKGVGYVVLVNTRTEYSSGDMAISIGISNDGKVVGALVTNYQESKDMGKKTYPEKFVGTSLNDYQSVDTVSGVTYSSGAFKAAVGDALRAVSILSAKESVSVDKTPALLLSSTEERTLPAGSSDVNDVFPSNSFSKLTLDSDAPEELVALYKNPENDTVVAHLVVAGEWVPIATEAFVTFDTLGRIVDMKLTQWVVGHGVEPDEDFAGGFVGRYEGDVDYAELVSGATGTSVDLRNAVSEVADYVVRDVDTSNPKHHFPEEEWTPVELGADAPAHLAALYKSTTSDRTVAHVIVPGEWVPIATEAFILYNRWGTIVDFKLTQWVVGHGVEPDQSFIDGFIGKSIEAVKETELVTGATGTSVDLRNTVSEVSEYLSFYKSSHTALGIVILVCIVLSIAAAAVVPKAIVYMKARKSK